MNPKISIIIPVFNRGDLVIETLESIECQTYDVWECLIIDDGSTDSTLSTIKKFIENKPNFSLNERPKFISRGATSCRNLGFRISNGDFVQWFDSDDIMLPTMLEEKVRVLLSNPSADFVVAKMDDLVGGEIRMKEYNLESEDLIFDYIRNKVNFFTPGPLFRRSFLSNKVLFKTNLKRHQESEFYFRLLLGNPKFRIINKSLALRRLHCNSIKSNISNKNEKYFFYVLIVSYIKSISVLNLSVWNDKIFMYFLKWSRSSIKYFLKFKDFKFLFIGFQLLTYSIFTNCKSKFQ